MSVSSMDEAGISSSGRGGGTVTGGKTGGIVTVGSGGRIVTGGRVGGIVTGGSGGRIVTGGRVGRIVTGGSGGRIVTGGSGGRIVTVGSGGGIVTGGISGSDGDSSCGSCGGGKTGDGVVSLLLNLINPAWTKLLARVCQSLPCLNLSSSEDFWSSNTLL